MASGINRSDLNEESSVQAVTFNTTKSSICRNCMKDVSHKIAPKDSDVVKSLEYTQKGDRKKKKKKDNKYPSLILENNDLFGKLFLGGFKAIQNQDFLLTEGVRAVINTAGQGLFKAFGRKFECSYRQAVADYCISYHYVDWDDSESYNISDDDMVGVLKHIHENLKHGAVLVHCAQGKSRSATAVVAYLLAVKEKTVIDALSYVRERRKMVDPNPNFIQKLHEFEGSEILAQLRQEFIGST